MPPQMPGRPLFGAGYNFLSPCPMRGTGSFQTVLSSGRLPASSLRRRDRGSGHTIERDTPSRRRMAAPGPETGAETGAETRAGTGPGTDPKTRPGTEAGTGPGRLPRERRKNLLLYRKYFPIFATKIVPRSPQRGCKTICCTGNSPCSLFGGGSRPG